jgi:amino acid adenylation domain-containing protein
MDSQVKIRGFRVEPGEIENRLMKHYKIKEAVVLARETPGGNREDKYLCAYILPEKQTTTPLSPAEIKEFLSNDLPVYMIPSYFMIIAEIPLTPTGKVDRKALPNPGIKANRRYTAPGDSIEQLLVETWSGVLGIQKGKIGIDDNFFELGGHSLKATVLVAKIHKALNVKLPLAEVFKVPTIRGLSGYIKKAAEDKYKSIEPAEKREYYALSSAQNRLYLIHQMAPQATVYNMPNIVELPQKPVLEKLPTAFRKLIQRHDSLRTSFHMLQEQPVQRVHDQVEFEIEYYDMKEVEVTVEEEQSSVLEGTRPLTPLSGEPAAGSPQVAATTINNFIRPFDLSRAPLLRACLIHTGQGQHLLLVDIHHIISDGISQQVLRRDFTALDHGNTLPRLKLQYKDCTHWQNSHKQRHSLKHQEDYWLKEFPGEIPVLNIPTDFPRPFVQDFSGSTINFEPDTRQTKELQKILLETGTTMYIVILALYNVFLAKICQQEDIVVGTPTAGRKHADMQQIIGIFVNTLALRNYPCGHYTFEQFLYSVKNKTLQAFENQEYPFENLVEKTAVNRDTARNPLFDVMFAFQDINNELEPDKPTGTTSKTVPPGPKSEPYKYENQTAKFDLTLVTVKSGTRLLFSLQYCSKLFKKKTIEKFIGYLNNILTSVLNDKKVRISEIGIISPEEKRQILYDFNSPWQEYPTGITINELFAGQVEKNPGADALVSSAGMRLTYKQLDEISNKAGGLLKQKGVQAHTLVGLMVEQSLDMIIGILGILKAGGAYVPLNPKAPGPRAQYILDECSTALLITTRTLARELEQSLEPGTREKEIIYLEELTGAAAGSFSPTLPFHFPSPSHPAYVIFTSGSTGKPKGVPVTHANLSPLLHWGYKELGLGMSDRVLQNLAYYFDWSVWEIFITLTSGAGLYIAPGEILLNPEASIAFMHKHCITVFHATPTQYSYIANTGRLLATLTYLFLGAEKLTVDLLERSFKTVSEKCRVFNMYGPTECTIITAVLEIYRQNLETFIHLTGVPIGIPVGNTSLLVLDKHLHLCPVNISGELYIGGNGLAAGYINDPEKTYHAFVHNQYQPGGIKGPRLYKTGDLARWLEQGKVEFLGRIDHQVKIRGNRIELGEIESRLLSHPGIKGAVVSVITHQDPITQKQGEPYLCAYIVPVGKHGNASTHSQPPIKEYLSHFLPDYMIPVYFTVIEKIPLNPNGKIDRKALPLPDRQRENHYTAPRHSIEIKLANMWNKVLAKPDHFKIGIDDNFFDLGGHSLKATILAAKTREAFNVRLPLAEIFRTPTIRGMAQYIATAPEIRYAAIEAVEKKEYYALSSTQKRMYILQQMELNKTIYNMPEIIPLDREPDIEKLKETLIKLINRHETLRTSFHIVTDEPVQKIHRQVEFDIEYDDWQVTGAGDRGRWEDEGTKGLAPLSIPATRNPQPATAIISSFIRPFDLSRAPLLRVGLIKPTHTPSALRGHPRRGTDNSQEGRESKYLLIVDMHHIISDGISRNILGRDFMSLCQAEDLPRLRLQYKDYAQWQNRETQKEIMKNQETFWLETFDHEIPVLDIPTDYLRSTVQSFTGDVVSFEMGKRVTTLLNQLARHEGVTLYMLLLALCSLWLSKLGNQEDIVIGTPIAGRRHVNLGQIIGMFVNTLAMRNFPGGEKTFISFLQEVKEKTLAAFENQEYPFEDLVDKVGVKRDVSRNPLFDFMLVLQNLYNNETSVQQDEEEPVEKISAAEQEIYGYEHQIAKFDITLIAVESSNNLLFSFQYCSRLFKKETIKRFIVYFERIISDILENRSKLISNVEIIPEKEKQQLLVVFNDTQVQYPKNKTIHQLFEEQVEKTPDNIAAASPREIKHKSYQTYMTYISYRELNKKSLQLAHRLIEKQVEPDTIVGIMVKRSIEMIIGIMGILKAGGAYLPLDPAYPKERIEYMQKDSGSRILLTGNDLSSWLASTPKESKIRPKGSTSFGIWNLEFGISPRQGGQLAYIIYTSGSTGNPKGTAVEHRSLVNACIWQTRYYNITGWDNTTQYASFVFDASVLEIFPCLIQGASLHIINEEVRLDPVKLNQYYEKMGITMGFLPTRMGERFMELENRSLRVLLVAGDKLQVFIKRDYHLYNNYGPTENTVVAAAFLVDKQYQNIPIGKPIYNNYLYILSPGYFRLQPIGVAGELCITGDSLSRGYLNNPQLTAEKFDHDLWDYRDYHDEKNKSFLRKFHGSRGRFFQKEPPGRRRQKTYRTGDLARWLPDGNIEFIGRIDHQVKLRGYRIELGEIENQLLNHPGIKESVVLARRREDEHQYLCAYIIPTNIEMLNKPGSISSELKEYLTHSLPDYMIPSNFIVIKKVPLTRSGKIDRNALPLPERKAGDTYLAPRSETEKKLTEIWSEVLGIEKNIIGINENFFELGGHSLKAAIMTSMVQTHLNVTVPLVELFKTPTIKQLSEYIHSVSGQPIMEFPGDENLVLLNKAADNENYLFFIHDGSGEVDGYIEFCRHLTNGFNCWGIRMAPSANLAPQNQTIEARAAQYIQKVRKAQPAGPYFIVGWSLGGTIAFEMCRQLEQRGEEPGFLALIDAVPPPPGNILVKKRNGFTIKSELKWIQSYFHHKDIIEKLKKVPDINRFWQQVAEHLEKKSASIDTLKQLIPQGMARTLPKSTHSDIKKFIYYMNVIRSLDNARNIYTPEGKIRSTAYFFKASQSFIDENLWSHYFENTLQFRTIDGDHFSILKKPGVIELAETFAQSLNKLFPG